MRSKLAPVVLLAVSGMALGLVGCASGAGDDADTTTLTLATWRTEDTAMWEDEIIPAFEESHPGIKVEYQPTDTNDYNAAIQSQMAGGKGPDLLMCRPFDVNRAWIGDDYFADISDIDAVSKFDDTALAAWNGDDGSNYCVPIASVLAGFYYNTAIFDELGLEVPETWDEFMTVLDTVKKDGKYAPLALGTSDGWQLAYNVLYNLGPNYWGGEEGRQGLIDGSKKLTDPEFVEAFQAVDDLVPYLPESYQSLTYDDMAQMFSLGQAAILPDGSWNINQATATGIDVGVFGAPVAKAGDQRYQQEMPDQAIGLNAQSKNQEAATEFLNWLATPEFEELYVNKLPGFFAMSNDEVSYDNELAQEFAALKDDAELTPRLALDRLSSGTPPLDDEIWRVLQVMTSGQETPEQATQELQDSLATWYEPQQG
jgi:raffinose/stachyose/melibiose transport system substrate-binding protein